MAFRLSSRAVSTAAAAACLMTAALLAPQPVRADSGDSGAYVGIRAIGSAFSEIRDVETRGFTGTADVQNDTDQVAGPAGVIGWRFKNFPLRTELEAGYRVRFDLDVRDQAGVNTVDYEINVATAQVVVNAIVEWRNQSAFTPFLGGTVGWARNYADTQRTVLATQAQVTQEEETDNIAWGLMAGVDWRISQNWSADIAYRFIDLGEVETVRFAGGDQISSDHYFSHDVLFSLYYRF